MGQESHTVPTAWADWLLGVESGRYEAVLSNVPDTDERKLKFDFASYRTTSLVSRPGVTAPSPRWSPRRMLPASA
ncbi:hypothetical protein [Arthrobacter sp. SPG23]|uniref:hypothetical protein n=1 Tax=Arthrobacter sp. SPG23 TaxID=1610703 RepID=UPI003FA46FEB